MSATTKAVTSKVTTLMCAFTFVTVVATFPACSAYAEPMTYRLPFVRPNEVFIAPILSARSLKTSDKIDRSVSTGRCRYRRSGLSWLFAPVATVRTGDSITMQRKSLADARGSVGFFVFFLSVDLNLGDADILSPGSSGLDF